MINFNFIFFYDWFYDNRKNKGKKIIIDSV